MTHAASLQISPVMVDLQPNENATGLTLRNPGDHPLYGQVRVFKWDQTDSEDTLTPTQDLIASPPLIQIAPGGEQLVRLVRQAAPATTEQNYRILIDEIPQPETEAASGVTIRLRYSVPVFVEPAGAVGKPELSWQLLRDAQGWSLRVTNAGSRRGQISAVQLVADGNRTYTINKGLLGYALAGRTRQWRIDPGQGVDLHGPLKIRANVNALPSESPVTIDPRR